VYTQESRVEAVGESELEPWTTFRVGRERYYSALDARLALQHGLTEALQLSLFWNFSSYSQDVVSASGSIERVSGSELTSASCALKYQLSDAAADALGSALLLETTLGPRQTVLEGKLIADRALGRWRLAANLGLAYGLEPIRNDEGSELEVALALAPGAAVAYGLGDVSLGVELHAPLGLSGDDQSAPLFAGPVVSWAEGELWVALGAQAQLVALTGASAGHNLALARHERVEVRLLVGLEL
jgi:hypothetical protein